MGTDRTPWYGHEESESEETEESWDPMAGEHETLSDADSEERTARPSGSGGPSEADRVYAELLKKGATPAIVAKQRKVGHNEVEMELFTPAAAVHAGLIPDQARRGRQAMPAFGRNPFSHFFSF